MNRSSTRNQITYHQFPAKITTSINDSFESKQSHIKQKDDWDSTNPKQTPIQYNPTNPHGSVKLELQNILSECAELRNWRTNLLPTQNDSRYNNFCKITASHNNPFKSNQIYYNTASQPKMNQRTSELGPS